MSYRPEVARDKISALSPTAIAKFILETDNRLGWETRLQTENSSDMNPVKDEFAVSNLSV